MYSDRKSQEESLFLGYLNNQDQSSLEALIKNYQKRDPKVQKIIATLEDIKSKDIPKKELKRHRNRISALLCRELSKLEVNFLKFMCIKQQQYLQQLDNALSEKFSKDKDIEIFSCQRKRDP